MATVDQSGACNGESGVSRRQFLGTGMAAGLAAGIGGVTLPITTALAEEDPESPGNTGVNFTWFGTNGWEIKFGNRTILIDPWFSRFDAGFFTPSRGLDVNFRLDANDADRRALIAQHISAADQILVGHGHWDHMGDLPLVQAKTGAMVVASETHANVLRAMGVPEAKLVRVKGGEFMQFDGYTIEVFPGLHSMGLTKKFSVPGHRIDIPASATKVGDLPEGDSLCYQITIGDKFTIFLMSTANFIERSIDGIEPDVALVASIFGNQIHDYVSRLLHALGKPKIILPTHWDNFELPFSRGPQDLTSVFGQAASREVFVREVNQASPKSRVIFLDFFGSFAP